MWIDSFKNSFMGSVLGGINEGINVPPPDVGWH